MAKGIFVHRTDSIYDDSPAERYQFPRQYLSRVSPCIGDWIIYYVPSKVRDTRGYFAVAKVADVVPDPTTKDMYLALIEPGTYLDFVNPVPFNGPTGPVEQGVLNEAGTISGRAQAAVRPLPNADFNRIVDMGLDDAEAFLPRVDQLDENFVREERAPFVFEVERDRVANLGSRLVRDRLFRRRVVQAYDARCSITGLKLINGGGRAEVEAAHRRPERDAAVRSRPIGLLTSTGKFGSGLGVGCNVGLKFHPHGIEGPCVHREQTNGIEDVHQRALAMMFGENAPDVVIDLALGTQLVDGIDQCLLFSAPDGIWPGLL